MKINILLRLESVSVTLIVGHLYFFVGAGHTKALLHLHSVFCLDQHLLLPHNLLPCLIFIQTHFVHQNIEGSFSGIWEGALHILQLTRQPLNFNFSDSVG